VSGRRAEQVGRARAASIRRRMPPPRRHPLQEDMRAAWSSAFSLIEILIVVALLGTIVAIALPAYMDSLDKARVARAIGDIAAISEEIALFWFDSGRWPNSLAEIGRGAMTDPYGELYRYTNIGDSKTGGKGGGGGGGRKDRFLVPVNSDFDLYSMGKDTATVLPFTAQQSLDDVVRANNGMFIGLAEDF
jgi:general secretion pathway protein G